MDFKIEDIDFRWVESTNNKQKLKKALKIIQDDGGYYPDLESAIKKKLNEDSTTISSDEINKARQEVLNWEAEITKIDTDLKPLDSENKQMESNLQILNFQQKKEAENLKILGNEAMKIKDYKDAVNKYSESIKIDAKESSTYCNRALAYIKLNDYNKALEDCNKTLEISPTYFKAYYRRGNCYTQLKKYENAWQDYLVLINHVENNSEVHNEINILKSRWRADVGEAEWSKIASKLTLPESKNHKIEENIKTEKKVEKKEETVNNNNSGFKKIKIQEVENEEEVNKKILTFENFNKNEKTENTKPMITKPLDDKAKSNSILSTEKNSENINIPKQSENIKVSKKSHALDEGKVHGAVSIATENLDFSYYRKNSTGFQQAYTSFTNSPDKYFLFLAYFTAEDFLECFEKIELSFEILQYMIKVFTIKSEEIKENEMYYKLTLAYMVNITKTKNFNIKKIMIKSKRQAFEPVINLFKNEKTVNIEKLYF